MGKCENCAGCGGCGTSLELTPGEAALLQSLQQYAFLPVARLASDETPVCLEDPDMDTQTCSLLLQLLERKGLIDIDYDQPLDRYHDGYAPYPVRGSIALTLRGQRIAEQLELLGAQ